MWSRLSPSWLVGSGLAHLFNQMATGYPSFIFQDAVPAAQMQAHAQAVNEGMRIAELGKARQAEGLFRMAQMQQQQKAQQEKNELDKMIAMSQIEQNRIGNEFKNRELTQRGDLTREGYRSQESISKQMYPEGRLAPGVQAAELRIEEQRRLQEEQDKDDLKFAEEAEGRLSAIDKEMEDTNRLLKAPKKLEGWYDEKGVRKYFSQTYGRDPNDSELSVFTDRVKQARVGNRIQELTAGKQQIIQGIQSRGLDYDPLSRRIIGLRLRSSATPLSPATQPSGVAGPLPVSALSQPQSQMSLGMSEAQMTPFAMQVQGLSPGQTVQQGGQSFRAAPSFTQSTMTTPPPASSMAGDPALNEYTSRYPGVDFRRDGSAIMAGGFAWDENMRRIAEDPNLTAELKQTMIIEYIRRKYPDLFYR